MGNCALISMIKIEKEKRNKKPKKKRKIGRFCCCGGVNGKVQKIYEEIRGDDVKI
tara:strand:+ start:1186 stop:1350 length:165 start_codon:yes stop_codon:yes gene_type:complete